MYTPTTGIWQTVWLEPVADGLHRRDDPDARHRRQVPPPHGEGRRRCRRRGRRGRRPERPEGGRQDFRQGRRRTQAAAGGRPALVAGRSVPLRPQGRRSKVGGKAVDAVESYFGMRKIELAKDEKGILRPMLNGKFVFQVGPLDQGFWPDGIYTAPTDEALRYDIEMTRKLGLNMARKHVKVEPERWYYWCDKLGLWSGRTCPVGRQQDARGEEAVRGRIEGPGRERTATIRPSSCGWSSTRAGASTTRRASSRWVKKLDPTRLVNNASGWTDNKCGDVMDMHNYPGPGSPKPEEKRAAVLGEFGGLGLGIDGHTWKKSTGATGAWPAATTSRGNTSGCSRRSTSSRTIPACAPPSTRRSPTSRPSATAS